MLNAKENSAKKIIIVGGVAGGMSAAARLRRLSEKTQIIIFERSGYVSFANCGLPYYLGGEIQEREDLLLQTPESLAARFNLDVRVLHEVIDIDAAQKKIIVCSLVSNEQFEENYDDLILSVGASPIRPKLPGIDLPGVFSVRTIEDTDAIENWIQTHQPKHAVVVGSGFIGLEIAEQFRHRGFEVTLIEAASQILRPFDVEMAILLQQELENNGVKLLLNSPLKEILSADVKHLPDGHKPHAGWIQAGELELIPADLIILGLGVRPEITLAQKAGLTIGERNGIQVNEQLETGIPNIWAVGDAIEVFHPISQQKTLISLGGPANRQGRIVANNVMGIEDQYKGTFGTAILRIFSLTAASTGLNEAQLQASGVDYEAIYLHPNQHAGYYPGAQKIALKVLFHPQNGKLYGAQAIGKEGVDKRIDVIATAIKANMTIRDLAELELCYAPPFGSAKDPVNLAGMMGENILDGLFEQVYWHQLDSLDIKQHILLDVRDEDERKAGSIPNSIHIPLNLLRDNLHKLPRDKTIISFCQSGQRSYFATRLLTENGFKAKNLSGAYLTFKNSPSSKQLALK